MPKFIVYYVKFVDYISTALGRFTMYTVFLMIGVLLLGAITRNILNMPLSWTIEMAQFIITGYYIVGGAYSIQLGDNVRMDLIYDRYSERTKAKIDVCTNIFMAGAQFPEGCPGRAVSSPCRCRPGDSLPAALRRCRRRTRRC